VHDARVKGAGRPFGDEIDDADAELTQRSPEARCLSRRCARPPSKTPSREWTSPNSCVPRLSSIEFGSYRKGRKKVVVEGWRARRDSNADPYDVPADVGLANDQQR